MRPPKLRKADPLDALRADSAFQNADPAARALLQALLTRGERAEGRSEIDTEMSPVAKRHHTNGAAV